MSFGNYGNQWNQFAQCTMYNVDYLVNFSDCFRPSPSPIHGVTKVTIGNLTGVCLRTTLKGCSTLFPLIIYSWMISHSLSYLPNCGLRNKCEEKRASFVFFFKLFLHILWTPQRAIHVNFWNQLSDKDDFYVETELWSE